mgnify:CR=1 FL=1
MDRYAVFYKKGGYLFNRYNICYYVLYLWSCGVYGALFKQLKGQSAIVRGMTYGLLIFAIEFFSGTGLKAVNACPWDYSSAVYNINGLVRLDYYPVWIFVGLVYERIYSFLKYNKRRLKNRP